MEKATKDKIAAEVKPKAKYILESLLRGIPYQSSFDIRHLDYIADNIDLRLTRIVDGIVDLVIDAIAKEQRCK